MSPRAIPSTWLLTVVILLSLAAGLKPVDTAYSADREASDEQFQTLREPASQETEGESDPEAKLPYLFAVYTIIWAGFFGYVFYMSRRQRETRRELDVLRRTLIDREQTPAERETESP